MNEHPLRRWRQQHEPITTLADLCHACEMHGRRVTISHLSQIENRQKLPSIELAAILATVTGVPIAAFAPLLKEGYRDRRKSERRQRA